MDLDSWNSLRSQVPAVWARYTDIVVESGSGSWVTAVDGRRLLDFTSGIGVTNTGHSHPRVVAAIAEQAGRIIHAQQNIVFHQPGLLLHDRLPGYFPGGGEGVGLFLSNSGAEAIEAAVKLAKAVTRRPGIIAFRGGFHGRTHAAMALTSSGVRYRGHYEPLVGGVYMVPYPDPLRMGGLEASLSASLAAIDELFATLTYADDIAAFVVEPILGEGGYVVPPDAFLPRLSEIAKGHGILLVVDEIQTGFGRTGRFFASEWSGARPDIVVTGKGIASGLPLSGILAQRLLLDKFTPGAHGGTYSGNAVACAAALATLDVIEAEDLIKGAESLGSGLLRDLREIALSHESVAEVRGRGLMVALEFADPDTLSPRPDLARRLIDEAARRNLLLLTAGVHGQVVRVIPPLVATGDEIDQAIHIIAESLDATSASSSSG